VIAALLAAAACSGDCRAEALFAAMERKLAAVQPALQLEVTSHAEGAIAADAVSELSIGPETRLHARGTFAGRPFDKTFNQPTTPGLRDALLVGLTRMGMLHNVVNLSQDLPPDHADADVRAWLRAVKFARVKGGVKYTVNVEGQDHGETTLFIDARSKLPVKRTEVIHFPSGDMRVSETYRFPRKR
jgi:hypothetical protein